MTKLRIEVSTKTFVRFWLVITALAIIAGFISLAAPGLVVVGLAIFFAVAIQPLAKRLDTQLSKLGKKHKSRPTLSAILSVVIVAAIVLTIVIIAGPVIINETGRFIGQLPDMFDRTLGGWDGINNFGRNFGIDNLQHQITTSLESFSQNLIKDASNTVVNSVSIISTLLTNAILVIVLTLLLLLQGPDLLKKFWKMTSAHNAKATKEAQRIASRIAGVISKYVTGQVTVAILDGLVCTLGIFVITLIFGLSPGLALPLGLIAAILYLIPMFGAIIACILISILLLFSSPPAAITFAIFYIIYQQIENNFIAPKIQGNALNLPSVIVLIAITIGMYMFGLLGAIISIPIAGIIKVFIDEYPRLRTLEQESTS